jgi:hypothetical protein
MGLQPNPTFQADTRRIATEQNCEAEYCKINWNCRKFEYIIGPIDTISEQSFSSRNSIGKVGFYVLQ